MSGRRPGGLDAEVVIVGEGLVSDVLALALHRAGVRVRRVGAAGDALPADAPRQFAERSIALALGSRRILETLDPELWAALSAASAPIETVHVSQQGSFGVTRFDAARLQVPALGYVLPARALRAGIVASLERAGISSHHPGTRVEGLVLRPGAVELRVREAHGGRCRLRARLAVGADRGPDSLRTLLGIPLHRRSYGQQALITRVCPDRAPAGVAYERFTPEGALALLPLADGRCGVVWSLRAPLARARLAQSSREFEAALEAAFGSRLGRLREPAPRAAFPLELRAVSDPVLGRTVLVGSAATELHPVAGQGFNLGLRDVAALAGCVAQALAEGMDPGAPGTLRAYAARRARDRRRTVMLTDGLIKLFGLRLPGLAAARSAGLLLTDLSAGLKSAFAAQTMGTAGAGLRLPRGRNRGGRA